MLRCGHFGVFQPTHFQTEGKRDVDFLVCFLSCRPNCMSEFNWIIRHKVCFYQYPETQRVVTEDLIGGSWFFLCNGDGPFRY